MSLKICSIDGCEGKFYARSWCEKHYSRWRIHGDPLVLKIQKRPEDGLCTVNGCHKEYSANGYCVAHRTRLKRTGEVKSDVPIQHRYFDPKVGFEERTEWRGDCLEWNGMKIGGYGRLKIGGRPVPAHRYAWERENGPIPEGMVIDHICHNPACCNVKHLRVVTPTQNTWNLSGADADNKHSGLRNVGRIGNRWRVRITKNKVVHYLGVYDTVEEAAEVAERGRARLFGEFAGKG